jgi:N-methylhydantoinase A
MADTLRELTIGKGHDPRDFHLYAYGGAGPLHCAGFGAELGLRQIVVPATSMVHSAYGALASDVQVAAQRSVTVRDATWDAAQAAQVDALFGELEDECRRALAANEADGDAELTRSVDMRFRRQAHELQVPVAAGTIGADGLEPLVERFGALYEETYGRGAAFRDAGIEVTTLRVAAVGRTRKPRLARHTPSPNGGTTRRAVFDVTVGRHVDAAVLSWTALEPGARVEGPALVRHPTTTVYAGPGQDVGIDDFGNLIITTRSRA